MNLANAKLSMETILLLMEKEEPTYILLNHMVIQPNVENIDLRLRLDDLPSFTVGYPGFVEVEMVMDQNHESVVRVSLRQAAMTFSELTDHGEVLPSLTISCKALSGPERARLNALAHTLVSKGKLNDAGKASDLMTEYADKVIFGSNRYGAYRHV